MTLPSKYPKQRHQLDKHVKMPETMADISYTNHHTVLGTESLVSRILDEGVPLSLLRIINPKGASETGQFGALWCIRRAQLWIC